ncbi:MAG: hypothetical protein FJ298_07925 [Planctomycetes bacterium]|nr:hypothetical protein [Planctomycetota bacterium]
MSAEIPEALLEPLRRALAWLASLRDAQGRIVCPEHKIEHTGKSAGAAVLAARLSLHDRPEHRERHRAFALEQGRRLVANLHREGTSECHTFWPGRHDKYNSSNAIIDGGACSAALAELVEIFGDELADADRTAFGAASLLHARTYLRYAVLDKGVPAQRAWGLTGLAAASRLAADAELERAAIEAFGAIEAVQNGDGSFPYHPRHWGAPSTGASDASSFYHSRIPAFLMYSLERLGRDPTREPFARSIRAALDFTEALHGPDGLKVGLVEAKPWYWGAEYEVASHVFDVYALARGWKLFGEPRFARAAVRAARTWSAHLMPSGEPRSHLPGQGRTKSYQCPVFWACHAEWIARALPELAQAQAALAPDLVDPGRGFERTVRWFPDAALARLEDDCVVAWVRAGHPASNVHYGSPHGSGLLRAVRKSDGANLLERQRWRCDQEGEWAARAGRFSLARGWSASATQLRFSFWLLRNHLRGGRWALALMAPLEVIWRGLCGFGSSEVSSAFHDSPVARIDSRSIALSGALAWRNGSAPAGSRLERRFEVDGAGLTVSERCEASEALRSLRYRWPSAATERRGEGSAERTYRLC